MVPTDRTHLPPVFDPDYYRERYEDLRSMSDEELAGHYEQFGRSEGRVASSAALREGLLALIPMNGPVLEIGPFCNPSVIGDNVYYFDVLDQDGLRRRAATTEYPVVRIPEVHFVSPDGNLGVVDRSFGAIFSSHCVEHQPDLVEHLQQVARILEPGGRYFLIVPDRRYCFDYPLPESHLGDVLDARQRRQRVHSLKNVLSHRVLITHNDAVRHWAGDHYDGPEQHVDSGRALAALAEFDASNGAYIDVHAWQFTPASFATLLRSLGEMRLVGLEVEDIFDTPKDRNEFTAILRKATA